MVRAEEGDPSGEKRRPVLHPLAGASLRVFLRRALLTRRMDAGSRVQRLVAWIAQFLRLLPTAVEKIRYGPAIVRRSLSRPPVFIVGHWRSGTTHLHNLLSRDPQFGFLGFAETAMPLNMMGPEVFIAREAIRSVLPQTREYDNVKLSLDAPQEEEMALGNLCEIGYYNLYFFPGQADLHTRRALFFEEVSPWEMERFRDSYQFLLRKLSLVKQGRQLLLKNPPSTTRIPLLMELFPEAKFIHIVRNPWPVFCSNARKFSRLFEAFAWQDPDQFDVHEHTLHTYERVMTRFLRDREEQNLPTSRMLETSYEAITEAPEKEIARIYEQLELDRTDEGFQKIRDYLMEIQGYRGNRHSIPSEYVDPIRTRWAFAFEKWGYSLDLPENVGIDS